MTVSSPSLRTNVVRPLVDPESCPEVHLVHCDGGCMERGRFASFYYNIRADQPVLPRTMKYNINSTDDGAPCNKRDFVIIPLSLNEVERESWRNLPIQVNDIECEDYGKDLHFAEYVAIAFRHVTDNDSPSTSSSWRYVSCQGLIALTQSAFAEYRNTLSRNEVFRLSYSFHNDSYSFQSHNGLHLHYNSIFHTVAFKTISADQAQWKVRLLPKTLLSQPRPMILCLAIRYTHSGDGARESTTILQSMTDGADQIDGFSKHDYQGTIQLLQREVRQPDTCTWFPFGDTRWIVQTDSDGIMYLVITALEYSVSLAVECCDELVALYDCKYKRIPNGAAGDDGGIKRDDKIITDIHDSNSCYYLNGEYPPKIMQERLAKEVFATRIEYELARLERFPVLCELEQQMRNNMEALLEQTLSTEAICQKSAELQEMAEIFKKSARKIKKISKERASFFPFLATVRTSRIILASGAVGGICGWLIGGPAGTAFLASQATEIALGMGAGVMTGYYASNRPRSFWSSRFAPMSRFLN